MTDLVITPAVAAIAVPVVDKMKDWFRAEEEIVFEWTSPEYRRISILWDLYVFEKGERKTIRIRGKRGFCAEALRQLGPQLVGGFFTLHQGPKELLSSLELQSYIHRQGFRFSRPPQRPPLR